MSRVLHLSNEQFDVLYDIMVDTVDYLESDLTSYYDKDGNEVEEKIEDYEAYKILLQLNNLRGKS
tara:strand:- start:161 stop:355 length:195 start_codon:yes stop_codon:yes gene_type:complete